MFGITLRSNRNLIRHQLIICQFFILRTNVSDVVISLFSHWVRSDSLKPHGLQHTRLLCPSLSLGVCSDSCPLSWCCYLTISSFATPFSFGLQSLPTSELFPMSQLFASGSLSIKFSLIICFLHTVSSWYICQSQSPNSSHPSLPHFMSIQSLYLYLYFCFENKIIYAIFLDSTCMH